MGTRHGKVAERISLQNFIGVNVMSAVAGHIVKMAYADAIYNGTRTMARTQSRDEP